METRNYERVRALFRKKKPVVEDSSVRSHKSNQAAVPPKVSIILLDWSCRERLHALDWLERQNVPRETYEIIWVELYDRVLPEVLEKADVVITLGQQGMYHKHKGYNAGVLAARGEIINISDSDAVFPDDFIASLVESFHETADAGPRPLVLMHHQLRTSLTYPDQLQDAAELKDEGRDWKWWPLNPNAGACVSFRKQDVVRYGGFDEHHSYRGYLCGPYDLAWRLVNAGLPQVWHDTSVVLWHFAHPDPVGKDNLAIPSFRQLLENTYPHVDMHALTAVEHFSTGRMLPLKENPRIHALRMAERRIGTEFERKYAELTPPEGFARWQIAYLRARMATGLLITALASRQATGTARWLLWPFRLWHDRIKMRERRQVQNKPVLVCERRRANIVKFKTDYYVVPKSLGPVDFFDEGQRSNSAIRICQSWREAKRLAKRVA